MIRGGIYALLAIVALIFALAAIGTNIAQWNNGGNKLTPWYLCSNGGSATSTSSCTQVTDVTCSAFKSRIQAVEAFYVITAGLLLIALIFAVLDHGNVHEFRHYGAILIGISLAIVITSLIGWAIAIAVVTQSYCSGTVGGTGSGSGVSATSGALKDQPGFRWRASPFLMVVVTFFALVMLIVAWRAPAHATAK